MQLRVDDRRLLRVFAALQHLAPDAREPALARLHRSRPALADRLQSLILHAERPATILHAPLALTADGLPGSSPSTGAWMPARIGRYRITDRLGDGGTSIVFEGEQESPRRRVAVKVLRAIPIGDAGAHRLAVEGAALAALDHPGIVRVLEAGVDDSMCPPLPYLVMERVSGRPLLAYAAANPLSTARQVELVAEICDAVNYAHTRGVIHRDLKPANILVDAGGRSRLLDFGLARLLETEHAHAKARTVPGEILGTPAYMSPEQARGLTADHRTDIYSLGIVLSELLTGRPPDDLNGLTLAAAISVVRERESVVLPRGLNRDLCAIVRTATAPDPADRYATAAGLAEDLRRWLRRECVAARRPSVAQRTARGAWRRRGLIARAAAAGAITVLAAVPAVRSTRAQAQTGLANLVSSFVTEQASGRSDLSFDARFRQFQSQAGDVGGGHADLRAQTLRTLAKRLFLMGHADGAEAVYRHAVAYASEALSPVHAETLQCKTSLARIVLTRGRASEALSICESVLSATRDRNPLSTERTVQLYDCMSDCLHALGRTAEAREALASATRMAETNPPEDDAVAAHVLAMLVAKNLERGSRQEAVACARRLVDTAPASSAADVLDVMASATATCAAFGDVEVTEEIARAATALAAHKRVPRIDFEVHLAGALWRRGRFADAEKLLAAAIAKARSCAEIDELHLATALNSYGVCLRDRGDWPGARRALVESLALRRRSLGETHPRVTDTRANLAKLHVLEGDFAAARQLAEIVLSQRRRENDPDALCEAIGLAAAALAGAGDQHAALELLDEARAARLASSNRAHWRGDFAITVFAELLSRTGHETEARQLLNEVPAATACSIDDSSTAEHENGQGAFGG